VLPSRPMEARQALADLMEVSSQVDAAVVAGPGGEVLGATLSDEAARTLAEKAEAILEAAPGSDTRTLTQLEAATRDGSVFVVRDGGVTITAVTGAAATAGLVFYDLKTCLHTLVAPAEEKPKRRARKKAPEGDGAAA
jgi:predicted regulator of Ras-like GTPase activity (Roadblock/LC7/MglB family)